MSADANDHASEIVDLRRDLKEWEKAFADAHGGRKPGREDIKKEPAIGAKYKQYHKLQKPATVAAPAHTPSKSRARADFVRPSTRLDAATTPRRTPFKRKIDGSVKESLISPLKPLDLTPAFIRRALGPTPQKDGQVLGIFDIALSATPPESTRQPAASRDNLVAATPSKATRASPDLIVSRTPQSSSRKFLFDVFAGTPSKRKRDADEHDSVEEPSATKRRFATPTFLRRSFPLATIRENTLETGSSAAPPFQKRGLVRSLSSIIQGLRRQEEERMDEDLDMLHELEDEAMGIIRPAAMQKAPVQDVQAAEMPLGPDAAAQTDEDSAPETTDLLRKPWKKKGLKRQTRRVIMRPVTHKAKKAHELEAIPEDDADEAEEAHGVADQDDAEGGASHASKSQPGQAGKDAKETTTQKVRKISAQAHANFRKLNIKNKNSKANGRGKRFGRR